MIASKIVGSWDWMLSWKHVKKWWIILRVLLQFIEKSIFDRRHDIKDRTDQRTNQTDRYDMRQ